ncbi:MAG: GNAT family N-acetyltransferase [Paludibacteraceae bacterium]|nr:GNAT family N-acetyltransferase [Paludibacteraceae bacterium]
MDIVVDHNEYGIDMLCHVPHGSCRLTISPRCPNVLFLSSVVVDENHRAQYIGTQMLKEIEKVAVDNGCSVISLQTWANSWKQEWYSRHGYIVVADGYDDRMVMMSKVLS